MVASKHTQASAPAGQRVGTRAMAGAGGAYAVEELLGQASALQLRAPELAMVLGERAVMLAESSGSSELWVRAESLVVSARVRLGYRVETVARAVTAMRAAEDAGYPVLAAQVRTDLAVCARSVGAPLTGLAALRPALSGTDLPAALRAVALCHLVGCISQFGSKPEADRVLLEADRAVSADKELDGDGRLLVRALLRVGISAHRRRHADLTGAADAARTGLGYLEQLTDPEADGGLARVRLVLQLVCSLLDRGDTELAMELAQPVLNEPARAASVAPGGWLRLAVATRILLPSGVGEAATFLLRDAVHATERHRLHALTSRLWLELAHVEERMARPIDALECLRRSRAAEQVHARMRRQACGLLTGEFGVGEQAPMNLEEVIAQSRRQPAPLPAPNRAEPPATLPVDPIAQPSGPELQLASTPTAEPVSPMSVVGQPEPPRVLEPAPRPPEPAVATRKYNDEWREGWSGSECAVPPPTSTRHDSEHGSVAARSVLDRLGMSAGGGGGRRRATDAAGGEPPTEPESTTPAAQTRSEPPVEDDRPAVDTARGSSDQGGSMTNEWLPRLRLPPSLAPIGELGGASMSRPEPDWNTTHNDGADTSFGEPFGADYSSAIAEDEPPADAGLADLLARALAEHQAGTTSAAALVKRLGAQHGEPGEPRPVNGHHGGGDGPDTGDRRDP